MNSFVVIATFFTALTAAISCAVAWRQHAWNKRNYLASVKPYLSDFLDEKTNPLIFSYTLTNKGLGPALIQSFEMTWDGKAITMKELQSKLEEKLGKRFGVQVGEFSEHFAIAANESFLVISFWQLEDDKNLQFLVSPDSIKEVRQDLLKFCRLKVSYKSFLSNEVQVFETTLLESLADEVKKNSAA
ncbi:UNVERIFIED_ORG: hypothetical protein DFO82_0114 [Idiomarina abyssalis]|jgi:hypothetical protein|uniref:Predicted secreted protein n=1 Tax=Idiomarina loihiensis (strain ATCC BAA-735 / DSM 15497 / L2-TR) TaxID=283942 RepID=Q5R0V1_IDILO|nr:MULTISPECIES: hypothetical protein [Idiomarina]AAV82448.1 Predicted secreted protein [Idiomarina loihiensis L2TR]AGM36485.1 hypothetical protein K734_08110 [Idiomarina loihiensis GSL 199]TDO53885.1 hypothetical protein DEU30_101927 [Idiomarina sp. 017G]